MRVFHRVLLALLVLLMIVDVAAASENNWRIRIHTSGGSGENGTDSYIGMYPTATDEPDESIDLQVVYPPPVPGAAMTTMVISDDPSRAYSRDIKAPLQHAGEIRTWDLRVYALSAASYYSILMQFFTTSSTTLPPSSFFGMPYRHVLEMIDNRGKAGAPANGTEWTIPCPAVHNSAAYFSLTLPVIGLTSNSAYNAYSQGYVMQYRVEPVPEPSGLPALGAGLITFLVTTIRQRRTA